MTKYLQGLFTGIILCISAILFIGSVNNKLEVGRYEYFISTDDITKKHYSRIFDTATGVVYHKQFIPGGDQVDIKWVDGERIERRHFRPDMSIWKSDTWDDYQQSYEENRDLKE